MLSSGGTPNGSISFDRGFSKKNSRMGVGRPPCPPPMGNPDMSKIEKSIVFRTRQQCIATFLLKNSKRVNTSFLVIQNGEVKCCYLTRFLKAWFI